MVGPGRPRAAAVARPARPAGRCCRSPRRWPSPRSPARAALIKWPNDVLVDGRKVAGILAEGRPHEGWAVLGIGVNVALRVEELPPELHATAGTLGLTAADLEPTLERLLAALERALALDGVGAAGGLSRPRRAARAARSRGPAAAGRAAGIDGDGRLVVELAGRRAHRAERGRGAPDRLRRGLKLPSAMPNLVGNAPSPVSAAHGRGRPALPHGDAEGRGVAGTRDDRCRPRVLRAHMGRGQPAAARGHRRGDRRDGSGHAAAADAAHRVRSLARAVLPRLDPLQRGGAAPARGTGPHRAEPADPAADDADALRGHVLPAGFGPDLLRGGGLRLRRRGARSRTGVRLQRVLLHGPAVDGRDVPVAGAQPRAPARRARAPARRAGTRLPDRSADRRAQPARVRGSAAPRAG